ncbi:hypothetical protein AAMO2058_001310600 [Amorphochlora amoebiformis]
MVRIAGECRNRNMFGSRVTLQQIAKCVIVEDLASLVLATHSPSCVQTPGGPRESRDAGNRGLDTTRDQVTPEFLQQEAHMEIRALLDFERKFSNTKNPVVESSAAFTNDPSHVHMFYQQSLHLVLLRRSSSLEALVSWVCSFSNTYCTRQLALQLPARICQETPQARHHSQGKSAKLSHKQNFLSLAGATSFSRTFSYQLWVTDFCYW